MSKKRESESSGDLDREARRAKRAKGEVFEPPVCQDSYCGGIADPCMICKDGATRPALLAKPKNEVKVKPPRALCAMCKSIQDLAMQPSGHYICEPCILHRLKMREEADRNRRLKAKAKGEVCVVCGFTRDDEGKQLGDDRWICSKCNRGRKISRPGVRVGQETTDGFSDDLVRDLLEKASHTDTIVFAEALYQRSSFRGRPWKAHKLLYDLIDERLELTQ